MSDPRAPVLAEVKRFCDNMDEWAHLVIKQQGGVTGGDAFADHWRGIRLAISKSCLLDRTMYCGEKPSQTPCPVHKGKWSGCHFRWPHRTMTAVIDHEGHKAGDEWVMPGSGLELEWYNAGCRCAYHLCGCTTGWQPDEHCGCGGEDRVLTRIAGLELGPGL